MDLDSFTNITPMGNLAPPSHTFPTGHMYFGLPFEQTGGNDGPFGNGITFPPQAVYAAADARVASLAAADVVSTMSGEQEWYVEYDLRLEVCGELRIRYGHIGPLSDRLQVLVDSAEPDRCNSYETGFWKIERCEFSPGWEVEAGELLAYTSGRAAAFDFGATRPADLQDGANAPECPLDLYGDELRLEFESRLGDGYAIRTAPPVCGIVNQDIEGTAQGRWYKTLGGHPIEDENIALVHDNINPAVPVFSIGNSLPGVQSNAYRFTPAETGTVNRDFSSITADGLTYCFEGLSDRWGGPVDLILFVRMPDSVTLRIEGVQQATWGSGPWSFSANSITYLR